MSVVKYLSITEDQMFNYIKCTRDTSQLLSSTGTLEFHLVPVLPGDSHVVMTMTTQHSCFLLSQCTGHTGGLFPLP